METQSIGSMVKILSEAINQQVNRSGKELNLTMQQMKILHFLKTREGVEETTQKDIQDYMRIAHPTIVNILRLMKTKGFIETSTSDKDKRMKVVKLTGQEEGFVKKVMTDRKEMEQQLLKGLSKDDQVHLRRYLKQMYDNVTQPR